jgi:thermitase
MPQLEVVTSLLNRRTFPVVDTTDKSNIKDKVPRGYLFESISERTNALGKWYQDRDGYYLWSGGLKPVLDNVVLSKLGIDKIWADGETGDRANVAILDSGIASNCRDLTMAVGNNIAGGFENAGVRMKNFVVGSNTMNDDDGHGSHCAGLIASRNSKQIIGVAKGCNLFVGKISDKNTTPSVINMINGISWAAGLDPNSPQDIDIISISNGSLLNIPDMKPTVDEAISKGKIIVAAIGNKDPGSLGGGDYPAVFDGVFSVGATSADNNYETYSYQYPTLTISCPGTNIKSHWYDGTVQAITGTSQSTAICSGILALLVSKMKKRNASNFHDTIFSAILNSPTREQNGYKYRYIDPLKIYQTI